VTIIISLLLGAILYALVYIAWLLEKIVRHTAPQKIQVLATRSPPRPPESHNPLVPVKS
jgi:hypothetical protein